MLAHLIPKRIRKERRDCFSTSLRSLSQRGKFLLVDQKWGLPSSSGMAVKVMLNGLGPFLLLDLSEGVRTFLDIRPVLESMLLDEDDDCLDAAVA